MPLNLYCEKWRLSSPVQIAETFTSYVYKVHFKGEPAVLKILTSVGQKSEASAATVLKYFDSDGAVRLLNADDGGHLIEYLPGRQLKELVANGQDLESTKAVCSVLNQLHKRSVPIPDGLKSMRGNFRSLFSTASSGNGDPLFAVGAEVAEKLISTEKEPCVLHGDIHHKNIIESKDRSWVAIDPQGLVGERTYDVANFFFNPDDMPSLVETPERISATCKLFSEQLSLDPKRILDFAFAYGCLSSAWCIEDGQNPERRLRITRVLQNLREEHV